MLSYHWSILKALRDEPGILIESQRRRGEDVKIVEKAIELDKLYRKLMKELDQLRHERNKISQQIRKAKTPELIAKAKEISTLIK